MNLRDITKDELRAEARRRGLELHSTLRELEGLRRRIDELVTGLKAVAPPE